MLSHTSSNIVQWFLEKEGDILFFGVDPVNVGVRLTCMQGVS